ncbi:MAG: hypothetical protein WAO98_03810, partial [Alphaproteobacteria bacterium]
YLSCHSRFSSVSAETMTKYEGRAVFAQAFPKNPGGGTKIGPLAFAIVIAVVHLTKPPGVLDHGELNSKAGMVLASFKAIILTMMFFSICI